MRLTVVVVALMSSPVQPAVCAGEQGATSGSDNERVNRTPRSCVATNTADALTPANTHTGIASYLYGINGGVIFACLIISIERFQARGVDDFDDVGKR